MSTNVRHLLDSFEALPEPEKYEAAVEILRRAPFEGDLSDATLVEAAGQLFQDLDKAEAENAGA